MSECGVANALALSALSIYFKFLPFSLNFWRLENVKLFTDKLWLGLVEGLGPKPYQMGVTGFDSGLRACV